MGFNDRRGGGGYGGGRDRDGGRGGFGGGRGGFGGGRGGFGGGRGGFGGGRGGFGGGRPEMHDAVCDKCKKECQVPFRPTEGKPILCSDCFKNNGGSRDRGSSGSGAGISQEQFKQLNSKLDKILDILEEIAFEDDDDLEDEDEDEVADEGDGKAALVEDEDEDNEEDKKIDQEAKEDTLDEDELGEPEELDSEDKKD